jgi:hypothetical protein
MKKVILIISLLLLSTSATAQNTLREISWDQLNQQGKLSVGEVLPADGKTPYLQLKLQNTQNQPILFDILTIDNPSITTRFIALTGSIKYEKIQGIGHLGMYTFYTEEDKSLQRTNDVPGPMSQLAGSSDWRNFILPLNIPESKNLPIRLEFEVFLQDTGTVYLSPMRLVQFESKPASKAFFESLTDSDSPSSTQAWWSGQTAAWMGAIGGTSIGLLGALIGALNGMGKGKIVVITSLRLMMIFGLVSLGLGILALIQSQPYAVYYPLLLSGFICSLLSLGLYRTILKRFEQIELRKMQALDTQVDPHTPM